MRNNGSVVTPAFVADALGVNPASVRRWIRDGILRAVNVQSRARGRRPTYRITREAFEVFLRERGCTEVEVRRLSAPSGRFSRAGTA